MKRGLFNLTAAVSLVLCVGTVALWVRSYLPGNVMHGRGVSVGGFDNFVFGPGASHKFDDHFPIQFHGYGFVIVARSGGVDFYWQELRSTRSAVGTMYAEVQETILGFGLTRAPFGTTTAYGVPWARHGTLRIPIWFLILLALPLPAVWLIRCRRFRCARWRREHGLCHSCGYDLRESYDRCPECGTEAKPQAAEGAAA